MKQRHYVLKILLTVLAGSLFCVGTAFAADMVKVQGEALTRPASGTAIVNETAADGGQTLKYTANVVASKNAVSWNASSSQIVVRARSGQSGGSATMEVLVKNGTTVSSLGSKSVTSNVYQEYTYNYSGSSGQVRDIQVKAGNVATGRNLFVDYFRIPQGTAPPPPPPTGCTTYSAPINITSGGTYSGCWESTSFGTPAVTVNTTQPVIIENSGIKAKGYKVKSGVANTDVTLRGSTLTGVNPNIAGQTTEYAVWVENPQNLVVVNNHFKSTPGVHVHHMFAPRTGTVKVLYNTVEDIDARLSNGSGGYQTGQHALRQFFQTDHVQNVPGVEVAWNQIINTPGESAVEDNINLYLSRGTSTSPINIHNNYIDGAFPSLTSGQTSVQQYTGTGIICADGNTGTDNLGEDPAYARCHHNQVLDSLNAGISLPVGHHIEVDNNRVVGDHDGIQHVAWWPVGITCNNALNSPSTIWNNNSVHDNQVAIMATSTRRQDYWHDGDCAWTNNTSFPTVDEAAEWTFWQNKLAANSITLGP